MENNSVCLGIRRDSNSQITKGAFVVHFFQNAAQFFFHEEIVIKNLGSAKMAKTSKKLIGPTESPGSTPGFTWINNQLNDYEV